MRLEQVISKKTDVSEAPAGLVKQMGRKIGAKALSAVGAKNTALRVAGKADAGETANELYSKLNTYVGRTGKNVNALDAADLTTWLKSINAPTAPLNGVTGILNKKQIDSILLKVAQQSYEPTSSTPTQQPQQSKQPKQSKQPPVKKIPTNIAAEINKLSPSDKKQLLGMLS